MTRRFAVTVALCLTFAVSVAAQFTVFDRKRYVVENGQPAEAKA